MARTQTRSSGLFSGLVLLSVGILLLLHNYGHLRLQEFFAHWWPLLIIFWGAVKLYERTLGRRFGSSGGAVTGSEVFLVLAMLCLLGIVVTVEIGKEKLGEVIDIPGDRFSYDVDVSPRAIPANARVLVRTTRGDITLRAADDQQIHVSAKKNVKTWNEKEADRIAQPATVVITQNGDDYEVHPSGYDSSDPRFSMDMEVAIPAKSPVTVRVDKGDVDISDLAAGVSVVDKLGDVGVRGTTGDVSIEMTKGDAKVSDTVGDVKISGRGGEVEVNTATGTVTIDGDFYGPVRADKIAKGVRFVSPRTDLTVSSLSGHLEAGSGNLDLIDAPGNVTLRTRDTEINVENPGGKVNIDNRNASVNVRFSSPPKDDVQITNSSSDVSLTLPVSSSFEIQATCRNCDVASEFPGLGPVKAPSGDASLAGKFGSGRGPKITLRTSYGNIALGRTTISVPRPPSVPVPKVKPPNPPEIPPPSEQ